MTKKALIAGITGQNGAYFWPNCCSVKTTKSMATSATVQLANQLLRQHVPAAVVYFAAKSHVARWIRIQIQLERADSSTNWVN